MMRISTHSPFYKLSLSIAISLGLFGCDASSDEATTNSKPDSSISGGTLYYAQDVIHQSTPTDTFFVNLSNSMESSDDSPVTLTTVMPLNDNYDCDVISLNTNGFTISAQSAKVCDYRYRVGSAVSSSIPASSYSGSGETRSSATSATSGDGFAEATVRAAVGESTEVLVPISGVTSSFTSVPIDIAKKLGNAGYSLDTSTYALATTVTLPNGDATNSTAIANTSTNMIDYTPGDGIPSGVERVLYTYSDGSSVLAGSIDIAVSTNTDRAPTASSVQLNSFINPDTGEPQPSVPWNKVVTIDVASLINDPDDDVLELIDVFSYGSNVAVLEDANHDGNRFNDTQFTFISTESGRKNVTYTVSDQKGGYATGVIQMQIAMPYEPIGNIHPPLTQFQAEAFSANYEPHGPGDGITAMDNLVNATFQRNAAIGVCATQGGALPSIADLQNLYDQFPNGELYRQHNWPIDLPYWASSHKLFDMYDGSILVTDGSETSFYTACIVYDPSDISSIELYNRDELTETVIPGMLQSPKLKLTFHSGEEAVLDPSSIEFSDENLADIYNDKIRALESGALEVTLNYGELFTTYTMTIKDPLYQLSGATVMSVGERKEIKLAFSVDDRATYSTIPLDNISSSNTSVVTAVNSTNRAELSAVTEGTSTITGVNALNGVYYSANSEVTVFSQPWCYKEGIINDGLDTGRTVCLGYTEDIMASSVADLIEDYGGKSENPYIAIENYGAFCTTFGLEPMYHRDQFPLFITIKDSSTLGDVFSSTSYWMTSEGAVVYWASGPESHTIQLWGPAGDDHQEGVPLCLLPEFPVIYKIGQ